jgi:hypothetical protein
LILIHQFNHLRLNQNGMVNPMKKYYKYFMFVLPLLTVHCDRGNNSISTPTINKTPAVVIYEESWSAFSPGSEVSPRLSVAIWPDGHVIWSNDNSNFLSAHINSRQVQGLLDHLERENVFDETNFRRSWFGPDSPYATIWLASGTRHTRFESWHEEFEKNPKLVALSSGIHTLGNRTREEALLGDTEEYQRFRSVWSDLRSAISLLVPKIGETYTGPTNLKLPSLLGH